MEETKIIYILYTSRGELIAALEMYRIRYEATHSLPERAESLHVGRDVVQGIPLPTPYPFNPL